MSASDAVTTAWQQALAAEHQAVFGYSLLGPRLARDDQALAIRCSDAHEALRNATAEKLVAIGITPVPPAADYPALYPVPGDAAARRLANRLEDDCAAAWRYLYLRAASATGSAAHAARPSAQSALTASAVRGARWRVLVTPDRPTTPFPGL